jgi:hypothetical protein
MTLLRMDVERTRATSELQAARAELALLHGAGPGGGSSSQQHAPPQSAGDAHAQVTPQQWRHLSSSSSSVVPAMMLRVQRVMGSTMMTRLQLAATP